MYFKSKDIKSGEIVWSNLTFIPSFKGLDLHQHFNPVSTYQNNFRKLTTIEFTTAIKKVQIIENTIKKIEEREHIVCIKLSFLINVSEGVRVCPLVARLNPEWRCKEWDEERTETYEF
jgi:hypothetical protein